MSLTAKHANMIIQKLLELRAQRNFSQKFQINNTEKKDQNFSFADFLKDYTAQTEDDNVTKITLPLIFYGLVILVSFFGNCLVCKITFGKSHTKSTINYFIGNISVSDLMMTSINIPLQLTEKLIRNWPLGIACCKSLHFIASLSVCVSTFTMGFIALDRFQLIAYPLKLRPTKRSTLLKILLVWIFAALLSFPYAWYSEVKYLKSYKPLIICKIIYPDPQIEFRKIFSLASLLIIFTIPLSITVITYSRVCLIIWNRRSIGLTTQNQEKYQRVAKWKTIKMLILVLLFFVVCWSPLVIYHTYQDITGKTKHPDKHTSTIWFICHWFAMCSSCCNPFIYCWLNDKFQKAAKEQLRCFASIKRIRSQRTTLTLLPQSRNEDLAGTSGESFDNPLQDMMSSSKSFGVKKDQLKNIKMGKTVAKALNHSVSVYIPKQSLKSEEVLGKKVKLKKCRSEAFV